jgi:hypothetical protein
VVTFLVVPSPIRLSQTTPAGTSRVRVRGRGARGGGRRARLANSLLPNLTGEWHHRALP